MLGEIVPLALKVLAGAIVIYIIAAFIVSIKWLLPYLAIASSLGNIFLMMYIVATDKQELIFLVIILLLFTQVCYQGEGFMNTHIVENTYRVVNVERKWKSIFEEYDDYEIHLAPKEIGGFIENVIFEGIVFCLLYQFLFTYESFLLYAIPIYIILMSLVDIRVLKGSNFSGIHWVIQIFAVLFSIIGSLYVPDLAIKIYEKSKYELCEEYTVIDYSKSYKSGYVMRDNYNNDGEVLEELYFIHDYGLVGGGYYSKVVDSKPVFDKIIVCDHRFEEEMIQYKNNYNNEYDFDFDCYYTGNESGLYKYLTIENEFPYETYMEFSKDKYDNAYITERKQSNKYYYEVKYEEQINNNSKYIVNFTYNADEEFNPTSLLDIQVSIYTKDYVYEFIYTPLFDVEETDLYDAFYWDTTGYYYIKGYEFDEEDLRKAPIETYGIDIHNILSKLEGKIDLAKDYDFTLERSLYGMINMYVYDEETDILAAYFQNDDHYDAIKNNDFETYMPNLFINNKEKSTYNPKNNKETIYDQFMRYTVDDENANKAITHAFSDIEIYDKNRIIYQKDNNKTKVYFDATNSIFDRLSKYAFYFEKVGNVDRLMRIEIDASIDDYNYYFTMYYDDVFDIVLP